MPADDVASDLDLMLDVVRGAGVLAMKWFGANAAHWEKSPGSPVTEADIAVNNYLRDALSAARPDYGWLSEETRLVEGVREKRRAFIVDPIDGTRAFMRNEPAFSICIARLEGNRAVAGVVYNPATGELFDAGLDRGARCNGRPIQVRDSARLAEASLIVSLFDARRSGVADHPPERVLSPVPSSIAYRMALVARGDWHGVIRLSPTNDWDIAAASLIVSEAGGVVTDAKGGAMAFNGADLVKPGVLASGAGLHALLVERVRQGGGQCGASSTQ